MHSKCRNVFYPLSEVKRFIVPDNLVPWSIKFPNYNPPEYNSKTLLNKPWADPPLGPDFSPKWNQIDNSINRKSYLGSYNIENGKPLNPKGRTGLYGRGRLGRWGPNHAADPIVTKWKMDEHNSIIINTMSNKPILQFCAIQRKDCGQWALPGGMVDAGENINETLKREFLEEALNSLERTEEECQNDVKIINDFFANGHEIYAGYVDDPRNTDNAWIETTAVHFHDEDSTHVGKFKLNAGDDAANVKWMDIDGKLNFYANHLEFIKRVVNMLEAHW